MKMNLNWYRSPMPRLKNSKLAEHLSCQVSSERFWRISQTLSLTSFSRLEIASWLTQLLTRGQETTGKLQPWLPTKCLKETKKEACFLLFTEPSISCSRNHTWSLAKTTNWFHRTASFTFQGSSSELWEEEKSWVLWEWFLRKCCIGSAGRTLRLSGRLTSPFWRCFTPNRSSDCCYSMNWDLLI